MNEITELLTVMLAVLWGIPILGPGVAQGTLGAEVR